MKFRIFYLVVLTIQFVGTTFAMRFAVNQAHLRVQEAQGYLQRTKEFRNQFNGLNIQFKLMARALEEAQEQAMNCHGYQRASQRADQVLKRQ
jgi:hypothetical protein